MEVYDRRPDGTFSQRKGYYNPEAYPVPKADPAPKTNGSGDALGQAMLGAAVVLFVQTLWHVGKDLYYTKKETGRWFG